MVELTDREKIIVHAIYSLINPQLQSAPFEVRRNAIYATLSLRNLNPTEHELTDIVQAINMETKDINSAALGVLGKYGHLLKGLKLGF